MQVAWAPALCPFVALLPYGVMSYLKLYTNIMALMLVACAPTLSPLMTLLPMYFISFLHPHVLIYMYLFSYLHVI